MIIVSQNKEMIINFKNINFIRTSCTSNLEANCGDGYTVLIGLYKTEERAKEILQDIIKEYRHYRTAECDGYTNVLEETAVYEMPED